MRSRRGGPGIGYDLRVPWRATFPGYKLVARLRAIVNATLASDIAWRMPDFT